MQKLLNILVLALLTAASATLSAAPLGYSINSDSGSSDPDHLYLIDLATGQIAQHIGLVQLSPGGRRMDVEGLAFAPDGLLYGIDDETLKLFRINPASALIDAAHDFNIVGAQLTPKDNDFGMSFDCDGKLFATSVAKKALISINPATGAASLIGSLNLPNVKISALAAYGSPTQLFGLSNGTAGSGASGTPSLYKIDTATGVATLIGALGAGVGSYAEGGLSFDESGQLWAITDRSSELKPSQVMRINTSTGAASDIRDTTEQGFESLAITVPRGCSPVSAGEDTALFVVQKRYEDSNDVTPVTLKIKCNGGLPLNNSLTVFPNAGDFGKYEVAFVVEKFVEGALRCEVWEDTPAGYTADYDCRAASACSTNNGSGPCVYEGVRFGHEDLCLIQNRVNPVAVNITKEWLFNDPDLPIEEHADIELTCSHVFGGNGEVKADGNMHWRWEFNGSPASQGATLYPDYAGGTKCWAKEKPQSSAVETENTCALPVSISVGDAPRSCRVTNTVFFEEIPTLNPYGLALISALMLLTGLISVRRTA